MSFQRQKKKMKRGFSTLYPSPPFLSSFSTHLCSLRHCGVSSSSSGLRAFTVSSGGEVHGRARPATCTGGWVIGTEERRMNSFDSRLNPSSRRIEQNIVDLNKRRTLTPLQQVLILNAHFLCIVTYYCMLMNTYASKCFCLVFSACIKYD